MPERISVIGVAGDDVATLPQGAQRALARADLVVGGRRHLEALCAGARRTVVIEGDVGAVVSATAEEPGEVCVLASGDPGFFGIVRPLADSFGPACLEVHPAPSSIALAFGRLGMAWDDATVVSAHGRPLGDAARAATRAPKVAVLVSPENPPEALGRALLELGARHERAAVCTRLGLSDEAVHQVDLATLAAGTWDPLSVVVLWSGAGVAPKKSLAWGLPDDGYRHRAGMVTKAEVRAVAIGKLGLPPSGVLWDVGAGSGSVAVECAALAPELEVHAIERSGEDVERIEANAFERGVAITTTAGSAPAALADLPAPDRVFVGGGGLAVLDAVLERLRPGGRVVATFAAVDRAVAAADRLGSLVQVSVDRGERLPDGGLRLVAQNPVFVVWGPTP